MLQATEELWLQAAQKDSEARRAKNRRAEVYLAVRWSEAIERNEAYESFSAVCEVSTMGPQINIIGSFFPSWMLCAAIGIVAALLGRWLFVRTGLDPYVGPPALVYSSLGIFVMLTLWVAFFRG